ncbi:MAG: hypothetical protein LBG04_00415 [Holosporaceae bacterium]|jgi:hypothetical protein|nr:hypothetical protein [Holosporaceae bacterium]
MKQGGETAIKNGEQLEDLVKKVLDDQEYQFVERNKFVLATNGLKQKLYTQQLVICESIYSIEECKHKLRADFIVYDPGKEGKIIIKCKSQTSAGSVDEKYPYLIENIKCKYPPSCKTIIILDAPAAKKGAKIWLKEQEKTNKKLQVFQNFSEFRAWAIKNL